MLLKRARRRFNKNWVMVKVIYVMILIMAMKMIVLLITDKLVIMIKRFWVHKYVGRRCLWSRIISALSIQMFKKNL